MQKLICKDALAALRALPDGCADAGVTSPPYNKRENKKGWLVKAVKYDAATDKLPEAEYQAAQVAVLNELHRVIKPGGAFFYNHKIRWERGEMLHPMSWVAKTKWTLRQEIVWDRALAANIRGWRFWQVDERIYWLHKPAAAGERAKIGEELKSRHAKMTSVWRLPPERNNSHPAPFPLALPLRALYAVLDGAKGVVIDPYCGSGTTLLAAKFLGCGYIGVDISKGYLQTAEKRLQNSDDEEHIWEREKNLHNVQQNDTFAAKKQRGAHVGKFAPSIVSSNTKSGVRFQ